MTRQDLGIRKEDQVLLIFSTWGPDSLIQRFGTILLEDIFKVSETYKVYLLIHPLNDRNEFPDKDTIFEFLELHHDRAVRRVDPFVSFLPYLVAADVVLTDHTSLFLYYALLKKPYLFVPLLTEYIEHESLILKFYRLQERYDPNLPLGNQLDCAIKNFPAKQHKEIAKLLIDESGYAKQRIRDEIAKFL
jgi:CDP-glycerol glycerophosphotransferase (TagB/SpsB family)